MLIPDAWTVNEALGPGRPLLPDRSPNVYYVEGLPGDRQDRYRQLFELVSRLAMQDNLQDALNEVLAASMSVVGADAGYIRLFSPDDVDPILSKYPFVVHHGISDAYIKYFSAIPTAVDPKGRLANYEGRRVIIDDMTTHPPFLPHRDVIRAERYISLQGTSMMSANATRSLGVIATYFLKRYTPPEATFETLDLYAELATSAIERHQQIARLAATAEKQQDSLKRVKEKLQLAGARAFSLEPDDVRRLTSSLVQEIDRSVANEANEAGEIQELPASVWDLPYGLSPRELEVLFHIWLGLSDKEVAREIYVSPYTVYKHVRSILQKMDVQSRTQASIRFEREGLSRFVQGGESDQAQRPA